MVNYRVVVVAVLDYFGFFQENVTKLVKGITYPEATLNPEIESALPSKDILLVIVLKRPFESVKIALSFITAEHLLFEMKISVLRLFICVEGISILGMISIDFCGNNFKFTLEFFIL